MGYDVPQELIDGDIRSFKTLWSQLPEEVKAEVKLRKKHASQLRWYHANKERALATNARYRSKKREENALVVKEAVKPLKERVAELEARLLELTERKVVIPMETIEEES